MQHKVHHDKCMSIASRKPVRRRRALSSARKARAARRTTVTLSAESQEIVERFRSANGTSTSAAIDQIVLRSEPKPSRLKELNGFLVLDLPGDQPKVRFTVEDMKRAEDDLDREYVERLLKGRGKRKPAGRPIGRKAR